MPGMSIMQILKSIGGTYTGKCFCENGVAFQDVPCPTNGDQFCESCDVGFTKVSRSYEQVGASFGVTKSSSFCVLQGCICENFEGVVGIDCPSNGNELCPKKCFFHNLHGPVRDAYANCVEYQVSERADIDEQA